ncbi:PP2C family serine/threonine-protein phosphatase [uncultured Acetatifactor sp.]|jgi:serine/threonine protein phosphatase PrpC|uniref:PP2C family protein-serine/threonine phosphatase n=1 Tax=uncultured Acetatifactor sp. TaxID=1671927 RepID=UPI0026229BD4|nr:hypothetical protein [uncultured Acetatifactor sp.]
MRRINSEFQTLHISEEGHELSNRDYFGYVEMDDFACYVLADSLDEEPSVNSARIVVESVIRDFTEAPTIRKRRLGRFVRRAHRELLKYRGGMHLKAAAVVVVTDYRKFRYCHVGNSRLYWIRNTRILERTQDQSLTQNMIEQGKVPLDEAAAHEERNNLYSFLGERGAPKIMFSRKRRLENGDLFAILTRGMWEQCGEPDFLQIVNEAKEPKDILEKAEDFVLRRQEEGRIDNYSLAVTFVNKTYQSPKKPWPVKKILIAAIPVMLVVAAVGVALGIRRYNIRKSTEAMLQHMESGEAYISSDNYRKAAEEYGEAKTLADSLGCSAESMESNRYGRLAEQVMLADEALTGGDYKRAQELFQTARAMAVDNGNTGLGYVEKQLDRAEEYMHVFDLIAQGERKEEYGNLEGAIKMYREAREKAAALYFAEGKAEAMELQMAAEEKLEKEEMADRERLQEQISEAVADMAVENEKKSNDMQSAIDLENQGNELLKEGSYEGAITFYQAAQAMYGKLGMDELDEGINQKINAARAGIAAREAAAAEAAVEE